MVAKYGNKEVYCFELILWGDKVICAIPQDFEYVKQLKRYHYDEFYWHQVTGKVAIMWCYTKSAEIDKAQAMKWCSDFWNGKYVNYELDTNKATVSKSGGVDLNPRASNTGVEK